MPPLTTGQATSTSVNADQRVSPLNRRRRRRPNPYELEAIKRILKEKGIK